MHNRGSDRRKALPGVPPSGVTDRRNPADRRHNGFISHVHLFAAIPYDVVEKVLSDCVTLEVPAGTVLLKPGQYNNAIHLLISGRMRIHFDHKDSSDFIPIEAGGCFGELSIIDGHPVSAYVVAEEPSRVLVIHESLFWNRLIPEPGVARNLLNTLSERMRQNRDMILERMKDRLAQEHLQKELSIAHTIQLSMLPPGDSLLPDHAEVLAYAQMEPAKNVGGDFYDAFLVAPDRLFIAVGDVSGKGVPAALFMARTMTLMRMEAMRRRSSAAILEAVNRALCTGNEAGMFVTLFCGMLDISTGQFSYANAGHNPPLFLAADGTRDFLKVKKGLVAGIMEGTRYAADTHQFLPGDSLLVYSDGVTEAMNPRDAFYSEARFLARVREGDWHDPRSLIEHVREDLAVFVQEAPQADDITLLALRYCGPAPA